MSDKLFDTHIAVTGTKGKSTILRLIQHILLCENKKVWGSFGIDGRFYNGARIKRGSPGGEDYFKPSIKCDYILTEANSFLLKNKKYDDSLLDALVFSSFDPSEHTEIHANKNDYLLSKRKIFNALKNNGKAIVCRDIENYREIVKDANTENILTYGKHNNSDFRVFNTSTTDMGTIFDLEYAGKKYQVKTLLIGSFNAINIAGSIACLVCLNKIEIKKAIELVSSFPGVLGRNNIIYDKTSDNVIVVDYAHTPESLSLVLKTWRSIFPKKHLVCIFGCGGEKSKIKRSLMGYEASKISDSVILTNDNPRSEDPKSIIADIKSNIAKKNILVILDRSLAIKSAVASCKDSIILIAGKGNERFIDCNGKIIPHRDWDSVLSWVLQNNHEYDVGQINYVE